MDMDISVITYRGFKFMVTKNPGQSTMEPYLRELQKQNVRVLVRVCDPTYDATILKRNGVDVVDLPIPDGTFPSSEVLDIYFELLKKTFESDPEGCVAIHCVSGLGRAPVLVAVALIELGLLYEDAVELIREKRRGAINAKQLELLSKYKPRHKFMTDRKKSCVIQ